MGIFDVFKKKEDSTNKELDSIETKIIQDIEEFDCHNVLIEDDGYLPAFVYSIGLYKNFNHPEIIVFGLNKDMMGRIINNIKDDIKSGQSFNPSITYSGIIEGFDVQFLEVEKENYQDYVGYASWYNKSPHDFPLLQLVWPDKENNWPWEESFNENWKFKQPLLDRNSKFKFYEEENLGVFTTYHVFDGKPILHVFHNEDGDWQFHTEDDPNIDDSKIVCLKDIIELDPTLKQIHYLNFGGYAYRNGIGEEWTIENNSD
jgi:hypothetical protein